MNNLVQVIAAQGNAEAICLLGHAGEISLDQDEASTRKQVMSCADADEWIKVIEEEEDWLDRKGPFGNDPQNDQILAFKQSPSLKCFNTVFGLTKSKIYKNDATTTVSIMCLC